MFLSPHMALSLDGAAAVWEILDWIGSQIIDWCQDLKF